MRALLLLTWTLHLLHFKLVPSQPPPSLDVVLDVADAPPWKGEAARNDLLEAAAALLSPYNGQVELLLSEDERAETVWLLVEARVHVVAHAGEAFSAAGTEPPRWEEALEGLRLQLQGGLMVLGARIDDGVATLLRVDAHFDVVSTSTSTSSSTRR